MFIPGTLRQSTYFTDDACKVSWGQGIILAKKDSHTDERVADHGAHIVKHVHRNCEVLHQDKDTSTKVIFIYSSGEIASVRSSVEYEARTIID
jgi:hypothetical protein